jgi:hypothetical protein
LVLLQTPPPTVADNNVVVPAHRVSAPLMAPAVAPLVTVTVVTAAAVPQLLVTM